jgi:hypothetical protein
MLYELIGGVLQSHCGRADDENIVDATNVAEDREEEEEEGSENETKRNGRPSAVSRAAHVQRDERRRHL